MSFVDAAHAFIAHAYTRPLSTSVYEHLVSLTLALTAHELTPAVAAVVTLRPKIPPNDDELASAFERLWYEARHALPRS